MLDPEKPFELIPWPLDDSKMELEEQVEMIIVKHQEDEAKIDTATVDQSDYCEGSKIVPICMALMKSNQYLWKVSTKQNGHVCIDGIPVSNDWILI